jgi:hypothetical protein
MGKFIPFEKLSKRRQQEINRRKRRDWGSLNPVTRKPQNPKVYGRHKARRWTDDSSTAGLCG